MKKLVRIVLMALAVVPLLLSESRAASRDEGCAIEEFSLTVTGTCQKLRYELHRRQDGQGSHMTARLAAGYEDEGGREAVPDAAWLQDFARLLAEHDAAAWDGFAETDDNVLDGEGFSLSIRFLDGRKVQASGSNRFPAGWQDVESGVRKLFARLGLKE